MISAPHQRISCEQKDCYLSPCTEGGDRFCTQHQDNLKFIQSPNRKSLRQFQPSKSKPAGSCDEISVDHSNKSNHPPKNQRIKTFNKSLYKRFQPADNCVSVKSSFVSSERIKANFCHEETHAHCEFHGCRRPLAVLFDGQGFCTFHQFSSMVSV